MIQSLLYMGQVEAPPCFKGLKMYFVKSLLQMSNQKKILAKLLLLQYVLSVSSIPKAKFCFRKQHESPQNAASENFRLLKNHFLPPK